MIEIAVSSDANVHIKLLSVDRPYVKTKCRDTIKMGIIQTKTEKIKYETLVKKKDKQVEHIITIFFFTDGKSIHP